jgi:hypothetical protein
MRKILCETILEGRGLTTVPRAGKILAAWETVSAEIAQLVEHATENRGVASSILALGTFSAWREGRICGCSSVVERLLAKEKVVGSSPIARSGFAQGWQQVEIRLLIGAFPSAIFYHEP